MKPPAKPQQGTAQLKRPALPGHANGLQRGPQHAAQRNVVNTKAPSYHVHQPVHVAGHHQEIRATIGGTPQVAGSINLSPHGGGRAFVSNLKVDQEHRRRGVAAKLIEAAVSTARRQGFRSVALEARPSDNGISPQALVAMYRRQGFQNVGKTERGSPLMERKLK